MKNQQKTPKVTNNIIIFFKGQEKKTNTHSNLSRILSPVYRTAPVDDAVVDS